MNCGHLIFLYKKISGPRFQTNFAPREAEPGGKADPGRSLASGTSGERKARDRSSILEQLWNFAPPASALVRTRKPPRPRAPRFRSSLLPFGSRFSGKMIFAMFPRSDGSLFGRSPATVHGPLRVALKARRHALKDFEILGECLLSTKADIRTEP